MGAKRLMINSDQLFLCKFSCKLFISKKIGKNLFYPHNIVVGEQKKNDFPQYDRWRWKNFCVSEIPLKTQKKNTTKKMKKKVI